MEKVIADNHADRGQHARIVGGHHIYTITESMEDLHIHIDIRISQVKTLDHHTHIQNMYKHRHIHTHTHTHTHTQWRCVTVFYVVSLKPTCPSPRAACRLLAPRGERHYRQCVESLQSDSFDPPESHPVRHLPPPNLTQSHTHTHMSPVSSVVFHHTHINSTYICMHTPTHPHISTHTHTLTHTHTHPHTHTLTHLWPRPPSKS